LKTSTLGSRKRAGKANDIKQKGGGGRRKGLAGEGGGTLAEKATKAGGNTGGLRKEAKRRFGEKSALKWKER